ncbi:MAG: hypothetical protein FVQ80_17205 [Planctomycetes bacterium]|nr:hypothetical protein [Planctomycetota bacterium]
MVYTSNKIMLSFTLSVSVSILCTGALLADQNLEKVELSSHSFEGKVERIAFTFAEPLEEDLYLEVYEFHYIMLPELAPQEDTWYHEKQMSLMEDVLNGSTEPYRPSLSDPSVEKILKISPKETIKLKSNNDRNYHTEWEAKHGRIFFRVKKDSGYIDQNVYSMRVHCSHIDMRSVEKLKELLLDLQLPVVHENRSMAKNSYEALFAAYTQGHSLQFMLKHHEIDTADLDTLFKQLSESIGKSDFPEAKRLLASLKEEVRATEELFYQLSVTRDNETVRIRVVDKINAYAFYRDPAVEVYIKEYREPSGAELIAITHGSDYSEHDPSKHLEALKPNKEKLIKGAIQLEKVVDSFEGILTEEWDKVTVVVLYGVDQGYYFTSHYALR